MRLQQAAISGFSDLLGTALEMLAWPVRLWLRAAEIAGAIVLTAWRVACLPPLRLALRGGLATLRFGERGITPARGLAVVALAATIGLGASQFSDYRAVEVGAPQYREVEEVAPAPQMDRETPRSAHGVAVFAIAVAALFAITFAVTRNWRLARLLLFLGAAAVLISLAIDVSHGLDEGAVGIQYQGAEAVLLGGFWVQLWSGVTLAVTGPVLAVQLRAERGRRARRATGLERRSAASALSPSAGGSGVSPSAGGSGLSPSAGGSGIEGAAP
jgi:hypothetical protein